MPTDTAGIDEAIARVSEIANRLNNHFTKEGIENRVTTNQIVDDTIAGPDLGINSEGVSTVIAGNRITSRQEADIVRRLEELKSLLDKMRSGKNHQSKIRLLIDSFSGVETVIRTFLIGSQFIARIVSR
ncbi:MAG: hypothetical protein OK457_03735 [Thaumarchaeota archaeon]|nr:hypothetical protein [Nitrososphaerota archaeon]